MSIISGNVKPFADSGYSIGQSLRFNDDDSAYLSRTPSVAGNRKTWTFSTWVKRGNLGIYNEILTAGNNNTCLFINSDANDSLFYHEYTGTVLTAQVQTKSLFRDTSAWYHILLVIDTTQATPVDRIKIYVNGTLQELTINTQIAQNQDTYMNNNITQYIAKETQNNRYGDGYLAETHFIDGQALTPDNFGEFDATYGHWKPIAYTGTYGTNGFYLPYDNPASIGADASGNGNHFTATNLTVNDVVLDSPTNNFATFNNLTRNTSVSFSEGNLKITRNTSGFYNEASNIQMSDGLYYSEFLCLHTYLAVGICDGKESVSNSFVYYGFNGQYLLNWGTVETHSTYTSGDIIGVAFNNSTGLIEFFKNGASQGSYATGLSGISPFFYATAGSSAASAFTVANFGQDSSFAGNKVSQGNTDANGIGDFYYQPPAGYLALCTANLPEPTVVPSEHFDVVTYTGNGTAQTIYANWVSGGIGFAWFKTRSFANGHRLTNIISGATKELYSNETSAEGTDVNGVTAFGENSVSIGSTLAYNESSQNHVAWLWKAGGTPTTGFTNAGKAYTMSSNPDAGFSITRYEPSGATNHQIPHGLTKAPELIITKNIAGNTNHWPVNVPAINGSQHLSLNLTDAFNSASYFFQGANTSSVIYGADTGGRYNYVYSATECYIQYCFHSVEGYSKIGSYVGNGSADGTFVFTGFRPKYILIKCASSSTSANWRVVDTERELINVSQKGLWANSSSAEVDHSDFALDVLSNGFKHRTIYNQTNGSGQTYLYYAIAETPFKYSNGR